MRFEKKFAIRFKYRKEKTEEGTHRIQFQKCKKTLQIGQASYQSQKLMLN